MRAFTILTLTVAGLTGLLEMRDGHWIGGAVLMALCLVGIVAHVWVGDRVPVTPPVPVEAEVPDLPDPPMPRRIVWRPVPAAPTRDVIAWGGLRRRCGHIERWQPLCGDCVTLLLMTPCGTCAKTKALPVTIVGCPKCPAVTR